MTTPISLRIDEDNLQRLDELAEMAGKKRNRMINDAIAMYLKLDKLNEIYRQECLLGSDNKAAFCKEHLRYWHRELPDFLRQWED